MITDLDGEKIKNLSTGISCIESAEVQRAVDDITKELEKLLGEYASQSR
jgi:hypothetical protein